MNDSDHQTLIVFLPGFTGFCLNHLAHIGVECFSCTPEMLMN